MSKLRKAALSGLFFALLTPIWLLLLSLGFGLVAVLYGIGSAFSNDWNTLRDLGMLCLYMAPVFFLVGAIGVSRE